MVDVPWNAAWTGEDSYEIRPCRWAGGALAIWSPYRPGVGRPIFARPHMVRQRKSIKLMLCTVCGEPTKQGDRWWFGLGRVQEGYFMTAEAPVHRLCADRALEVCPYLKGLGAENFLARFPEGHVVLHSIIGGSMTEEDFGVKINGRTVVGHLKIAWPQSRIPDLGVIGRSVVKRKSHGK